MQQTTEAQSQPTTHWPSILQLGFSLVGTIFCWGFSALFLASGATQLFSNQGITDQVTSLFLIAAGAGLGGFLLLPSAAYAFQRLTGRIYRWVERTEGFTRRFLRPGILILLFPVVVIVGYYISRNTDLAWFALPPLHLLGVGLPLWWLVSLGMRRLPAGSRQRAWGVFGIGLVLGPTIIFFLELLAMVGIFTIAIVYIAFNPPLLQELNILALRLSSAGQSPEKLLPLLTPYLTRPIVVFTIFAFMAGIVPLIEEIFKPVGVWFLAGQQMTPAGGFVAGLISGLGYALFESLALSTMTGEGWATVVVTRVGTGLLHILTSGLTGWALVSSWRDGMYLRLAAIYLVGVTIHGLWNAMALIAGIQGLPMTGVGRVSPLLSGLSTAAVIGLFLLAIFMFALLLYANATLRRKYETMVYSNTNGGTAEMLGSISPDRE